MIKFDNVQLSPTTRILTLGKEVIIGNIAYDGRYIKTLYEYYENITNYLGTENGFEEMMSNIDEDKKNFYVDLLMKLNAIHVFSDTTNKNTIAINSISLELTTSCNLNCKHCSSSYSCTNTDTMDFSIIIHLAKWAEKEKIPSIVLSGGEIYTIKNIDQIIRRIKHIYSGNLEIITNATLIKESNIKTIIDCIDMVNISFDGYDESSVDFIRGKHVYRKIIKTISKLHEHGYKNISASMVLTDDNRRNKSKFEALCKSLDVFPMCRILTIKGRALENLNQLIKNEDSPFTDINVNKLSMISLCAAGVQQIAVLANSKLKLCPSLDDFDLGVNSLSEKTNLNDVMATIRRIPYQCVVENIEGCKECPVRYFCSSNCISINYITYNNEYLKGKRCLQYKDLLLKSVWSN